MSAAGRMGASIASDLNIYNKEQSKRKTGDGDIVAVNARHKGVFIKLFIVLLVIEFITLVASQWNPVAIILVCISALEILWALYVMHKKWIKFDAEGFDKRVSLKRTKRYTWDDISSIKYSTDAFKIMSPLGNIKLDVSWTNYEIFKAALSENVK